MSGGVGVFSRGLQDSGAQRGAGALPLLDRPGARHGVNVARGHRGEARLSVIVVAPDQGDAPGALFVLARDEMDDGDGGRVVDGLDEVEESLLGDVDVAFQPSTQKES